MFSKVRYLFHDESGCFSNAYNPVSETQVFELERDLDLTRQKLESTLQSQSLLNGDKEALTEKCQEAQQKIENLQEKSQL